MWDGKSKQEVVKAQQQIQEQIFGLLDLLAECSNTRFIEGQPVNAEVHILEESMMMAKKFIDEATARKTAIHELAFETQSAPKLSMGLLLKMQSHAFPEVLMNQVMSFIPTVYRWDSLRMKYTNDFLTEGLKKKTVSRIKTIYKSLYKEAGSQVAFMKKHEGTKIQQFSKKNQNGRNIDTLREIFILASDKWNLSKTKEKKIEAIVWLYRKLERKAAKWIVKKEIYEESCSNMVRILHSLVIAVKPTPKKPRVRKVRAASA
jgi:hypothetical protein